MSESSESPRSSDSPQSSEFKPIPYSFTLTDIYDKPIILEERVRSDIVAHCPPFHILLDHTIAILWMLFSTEEVCPLRSAQITWALKFLEGMTNDSRNQNYAEDIQKAIQCLQSAHVKCISRETPLKPNSASEQNNNPHGLNGEISEDDELESSQPPNSSPLKSILLRDMLGICLK